MTTTTKTTEKATTKQINFILKLNPEAKMEEIQDLTKKQASWMIHELLNNQQNNNAQTAPEATNPETISELLKTINWDELKKKYNAFMTYGYKGTGGPVVYNDHNGANSNSELLKDMRKFKSYLNKLIKEEFHGLLNFKISARTSRHWACSDEVVITITASKDIMCKTFAELERAGKVNDALRSMWAYGSDQAKSEKAIHAYYKYHAIYNVKNDMLKPEWQNLKDFLESLLNSFSYNHSDIMTDYFDNGLYWRVDMKTEEEQEDWESVENFFYLNFDNEEAILAKYPVSDEEHEEAEKASAEYWEEWEAYCEEQRKKEEAERIEREKREAENKKKQAEANKDAKVEELPESEKFYCKVSMVCKPSNIQEISEYEDNETKSYYITHKVTFSKQESWDFFKKHLLRDWDFLDKNSKIFGGCDFVNADTKQPLPDDEQEQAWNDLHNGTLSDNINIRNHAIIAIGTDDTYLIIDPEGFAYCRYAGIYCPSQEQTYNNQGETKALLA